MKKNKIISMLLVIVLFIISIGGIFNKAEAFGTSNYSVSFGEIKDGKVDAKITFASDLSDELGMSDSGWTKTSSTTATKTMSQGGYDIFLETLESGDVAYGIVCAPFELTVGQSMSCYSDFEDYASSDESVLKIEDGKIKAVGAGTAKITANSRKSGYICSRI